MASQVYNEAKRAYLAGELNMVTDDIRVAFLMTNTTADTENDAIVNVVDFTTLDEMDGANYVRQVLATQAVNKDDPNDRSEFDADDVSIAALGNGTRLMAGALLYKHVTNDTDSIVVGWIEFAAPVNPGGSTFTIQWNAEGILQLA